MAQTGFVYGPENKPVKDMTEQELKTAQQEVSAQLAAAGSQLSACLQLLQVNTAILNVVKYELDRRANSIQIAHTLPTK